MVKSEVTIRAVRIKTESAIKKNAPKSESTKTPTMSRYIRKSTKLAVLARQRERCANEPGEGRVANRVCENTGNTEFYACLLWKYCAGKFDEAGCQYDHIREFSRASRDFGGEFDVNGENNIQALCHACHWVKTRAFAQSKREICGDDIIKGGGLMAVDV